MDPNSIYTTLSRHILADGMPIIYDAERSSGSKLFDAKSQKAYLDLFSFFASAAVGHNHPQLNDKAFHQRIVKHAAIKPSNSDIYTEEYCRFVDTFGRLTSGDALKYYFFISGGALAVENTLKAAFDWKVRKLGRNNEPDVNDLEIIHFEKAFHGRSGYTLSLTNTNDPRKYVHFPKFDWPRVSHPSMLFPRNTENEAQTENAEKQTLKQIKTILEQRRNKIAGLIIEPIQGEGGDNHARPEFFRALRALANEYEFLLIFDEVQTGLGLTGTMWCYEQLDCVPDIIAFGKKTQVCGIAATARMDEVEDHVFKQSSRINSTFGGNLIDMIRCQQILTIIEQENLLDHVRTLGTKTLTMFETLAKKHPHMTNVRGRGLMIAFDLPSTPMRNKFIELAFEKKILVIGCGECSIRLRPHLNIPEQLLFDALDTFETILTQLEG